MRQEDMWSAFDNGGSIGEQGSELGIIIRDEEHEGGSRITIERDGATAPFAITCGIYGWMVHTRYFLSEAEAQQAFKEMQTQMDRILRMIPFADAPELNGKVKVVSQAISEFVEQYP